MTMEILSLLKLLITRPAWAKWVMQSYLGNRTDLREHAGRWSEYKRYEATLEQALQKCCGCTRRQVHDLSMESAKIKANVVEPESSTIPASFDASELLGQFCYCVVRMLEPSIVVETGIGRGLSSLYILEALQRNAKGHLYSIELPSLRRRSEESVGILVPQRLRSRWSLLWGPGIIEMRKLRRRIENIDMFLHDSDHSYRNQIAEYRIALAWLAKGGMLVSDDVHNDALLEASEAYGLGLVVTRQPKTSGYVGILLK